MDKRRCSPSRRGSAWPPPPPGFACSGFTHRAMGTALHFRAEHGFAIFHSSSRTGSPVRAIGHLPLTIGTVALYMLRARVPHDVVMVCGDSPVSVESEH